MDFVPIFPKFLKSIDEPVVLFIGPSAVLWQLRIGIIFI